MFTSIVSCEPPGTCSSDSNLNWPVQAIVDRRLHVLHRKGLGHHSRQKGQREKPVRHRHSERPSLGTRGIQVNPLMVISRVGEFLDAWLLDAYPAAAPDVLTDLGFQLLKSGVRCHA